MGQEFHVIRCYTCLTFQTHIVKKIKKWECKMCGEKQSLKKVYGQGTGKDCRLHTQKLNELRLKKEESLYNHESDEGTLAECSISGNHHDEDSTESGFITQLTGKYEINYDINPRKKRKLTPVSNHKSLEDNDFIEKNNDCALSTTLQWNMFKNTGSASFCHNRSLSSGYETSVKTHQENKSSNSKWGKYLEETKQLQPNNCVQEKRQRSDINVINNTYTQCKTTSMECYGESKLHEESHKYLMCDRKAFDKYSGNELNENEWRSLILHRNVPNNLDLNYGTKNVENLIDSDQGKLQKIENNKQDNKVKLIFEQNEDCIDFEIDL